MNTKFLLICMSVTLIACSDRSASPSTPKLDPQLQAQLVSAIEAKDVAAVSKLLDAGAVPDKQVGDSKSPLVSALAILEQTKGQWKLGESQMRVLQLLAKKIRHRDGAPIELVGSLSVTLQRDATGVGSTVDALTLTTPDKKTHPVAIAFEETTFVGVPGGAFMFPVEFSRQYGLRGVVVRGTLEVEEIRYVDDPPTPGSKESKAGIVIPISPMLPSTMEYLRPMLEKGK